MPYLIVDVQERVVRTNQATLDMLEIEGPVENCLGKTLAEVFYNDPGRETFVGQSMREGTTFRDLYVPITDHRGRERHVLANVFPLYSLDGACIGGMCLYVDFTLGKQIECQLKELATTDSLTGLNNRQHFLELAGLLFDTAKRYGSSLVVAIFDIDHFKSVNDTRGHDAGDVVLKNLSRIALATLRSVDVLGRIGGEEFAVAMPETNYPEAMSALERFRQAVESTPTTYEQLPLSITISCGVAPLTSAESTLESLMRKADVALYAAKRGGRNRVEAFLSHV